MNEHKSNNYSSGGSDIGIISLVVLVILKLSGLIDLPWIWVLSPLWIGVILAILLIAINLLLHYLRKSKRRNK